MTDQGDQMETIVDAAALNAEGRRRAMGRARVEELIKYRQMSARNAESTAWPINSAVRTLGRWHDHCETEHGATILDYRKRVLEWHRENYPDCTFRATIADSDCAPM